MGKVEFTKDAEIRRVLEPKTTWELFSSTSLVQTLHKARSMGWKSKEIQVRAEKIGGERFNYIIEPFERDCECPNILKYGDFFD
jgi:hypothetical protein